MAESIRPELCIVGAGALGIALALHAKRLGADVALVDRGFVEPGDGPQRALRLASLAASAEAASIMARAGELGLAAGPVKVNMRAVQDRAQRVAREQAPQDSASRLGALGIRVMRGPTRFVDAATLMVGDMALRPQAIVLATGAQIDIPPIPGLDQIEFFTPDSILDAARKLTHLLVIGADPDALVLAQVFARLGAEVTLVPQGPVLAGFDMEAASIMLQSLGAEGVRIIDGATIEALQPRSQGIGAIVRPVEGEVRALDVSHVLVAHTLAASIEDIGPELARLRPLRGKAGQLAIGALGQTSNRRIRVVGAAAGIGQWQHALAHGRSVIEALVLGTPRHRPGAQPRLVMTAPALAQIGQFPAAGKAPAPGHGLVRMGLSENDKARALGQTSGLVKILVNPQGRIVAASVVGPDAGELAGILALAMDRGVPLGELAELSLPHPSLMATLARLGEKYRDGESVSALARQIGAVRRRLRL